MFVCPRRGEDKQTSKGTVDGRTQPGFGFSAFHFSFFSKHRAVSVRLTQGAKCVHHKAIFPGWPLNLAEPGSRRRGLAGTLTGFHHQLLIRRVNVFEHRVI